MTTTTNPAVYTMTEAQLHSLIRAGQEYGWDAAVKAMTYEDGSKVEVAANDNPYRV